MAQIKHRKCGGTILVDVAQQFTLRTHNIQITPGGVKAGLLELNLKPEPKGGSYVCGKCDRSFDFSDKDSADDVVAMCLVCSRNRPVSEIYVSFHFPCICESCKREISGGNKTGKEDKARIADYLNVSLSDIEFVPLVKLLKNPIN